MTDTTVKPLLSLVSSPPDAGLVELLEDTLAKAEKGEVLGMAYLIIQKGGNFLLGTKGENMNALLAAGAMEKLKLELLESI